MAPVALPAPSFEDVLFAVEALRAAEELEGLADWAEESAGTQVGEEPEAPPIVIPITPTATPAAASKPKPVLVNMRQPSV